MIITIRQYVASKNMLLGQRSRSQPALKVCAFQIDVQLITSSCMVGCENYLAEMIIMTRRCVASRTMSLGERSRSQPALLSLCIP